MKTQRKSIEDSIIAAFEKQKGFSPIEVSHAYPASLDFHAYSETMSYVGRLTPTGRPVKDSIKEDC